MGINNKNEYGNFLVGFLLVVIVILITYVAWNQGYIFNEDESLSAVAVQSQTKNQVDKDEIISVKPIEINFWEARIKSSYRHKTGRKPGYLGVYADFNGDTVGLTTKPGERSGIALVNRPFNNADVYISKGIRTRLYDPYRNDHNYAERNFEDKLIFPGVESLPQPTEDIQNRFSDAVVILYRNIPDYIKFAESLYLEGFAAEKTQMHLAVCPRCAGSIIFGDDITIAQLQSVLKVLKERKVIFDKIYYDEEDDQAGKIHIGNTPPKGAKSYWKNIDQLLVETISDEQFFALLGFELKTPKDRAQQLYTRAKKFINNKSELKKARMLLDKAIALDDGNILIYLEMARHTIAAGPFNENAIDKDVLETADKAIQIVESALKIDPEFADSYLLLGYLQSILGQYKEANISLKKAEKLGTTSPWLNYYRGLLSSFQNDTKETIKYFSKVILLDPKDSENIQPIASSLKALTQLYMEQGLIDEAFKTYSLSYHIFNNWYEVNKEYLILGIAYGRNKEDIARLLEDYKSRNWDIAFHATAMQMLVSAGNLTEDKSADAVKLILRAQASDANFTQVVADLLKGDEGRKAIDNLLKSKLLTMTQIEQGSSLLIYTMRDYKGKAFDYALNHGAETNRITRSEDVSPLMVAVILNEKPLIKILLVNGANPEQENSKGISALKLAKQLGYQDVEILMSSKLSSDI